MSNFINCSAHEKSILIEPDYKHQIMEFSMFIITSHFCYLRRYRRTGTVLEVIYSLKDAADRMNSTTTNNRRSVLDDIVDTGNDSYKVVQLFQEDNTVDELSKSNNTGSAVNNGDVAVENIELLNYRRLNSGNSQHLVNQT